MHSVVLLRSTEVSTVATVEVLRGTEVCLRELS